MTLLLFVLGLAALVLGAELLVQGASRLARAMGISPLVVGLTVVAFGTSSPELSVSTLAALSGETGIAVGNVVGSNIFNVLFILGLAAVVTPLTVAQRLVRIEVPILIGVSALFAIMAWDGYVGRREGFVLALGLCSYVAFQVFEARRERDRAVLDEYGDRFDGARRRGGLLLQLGAIAAGLGLLIVGSKWLVESAIVFAQWLGVSEVVIGLTVVAAGTSLPEVAASVLASVRGERDIAVGNVVGSGIFNILGVAGIAALLAQDGLPVAPGILGFDLPVMLAVAVACLPILFTGYAIERWEGAVFLGYYVAYTGYVTLNAIGYPGLPALNRVMVWFVLPLTVLTLAIVTVRAVRARPVR